MGNYMLFKFESAWVSVCGESQKLHGLESVWGVRGGDREVLSAKIKSNNDSTLSFTANPKTYQP